jgi:hypothetical protein
MQILQWKVYIICGSVILVDSDMELGKISEEQRTKMSVGVSRLVA